MPILPLAPGVSEPFTILQSTTHARLTQGEFPCVQCGACCRAAGKVPELALAGYTEPNGHCIFLSTQSGKSACTIYPIRPGICRVDRMKSSLSPDSTQAEWHAENLRACLQLLQSEAPTSGPCLEAREGFLTQLRSLLGAQEEAEQAEQAEPAKPTEEETEEATE